MKLSMIALHVGLFLIFGPLLLDWNVHKWIYYGMCVVGLLLCAIAGYNAQAIAVGMDKPGEKLLYEGWRWFKQHVLRIHVAPEPLPDPMQPHHESVVPKPPRSLLSKVVLVLGIVMLLMPITFWPSMSTFPKFTLLIVGSFLVMVSRRNFPPQGEQDSPHGQEVLQVWWFWLKQVFRRWS